MQILKKLSLFLFLSMIIISCDAQNTNDLTINSIKEKLNVPFGTLVKLKIEIIDGKSLKLKEHQSGYLMKVLETNDAKLEKPFIIDFEDQTGEFPKNDFALYEFLYGKKVEDGLSSDKIEEMNKVYIGKVYYVLAYESGCFGGIPNVGKYVHENSNAFRLARQDTSFFFKNHIVIDTKISE